MESYQLTLFTSICTASALASGRVVAATLHVPGELPGLACQRVAVLSTGTAPAARLCSGSGKQCRRPAAPQQILLRCIRTEAWAIR